MKADSDADLPLRLRVGLPVACVGVAVIFVWAHLLPGASTMLTGHAVVTDLDKVINQDNLISAVGRLADSHAMFMAFIVAGLSGVWPYVKLALTWLVVCLTDRKRVRLASCYNFLNVLEAFGKYSFADVFLILMNLLIFDISTGGSYRILGFGQLSLHLYMDLHAASVLLIVGVLLSAVVTGWAVIEVTMKQSGGVGDAVPKDQDGERQPLLDEDGEANRSEADLGDVAPAQAKRSRFFVPSMGLACFLALLAIALTIVGACAPYIRVERGGFLGKLIRPYETQVLELSIFSTTSALLAGDGMSQFYGVISVIISFVMPVIELAGIAVCTGGALWKGASSRLSRLGQLAALASHSCACIDVLLLVALATLAELHTVVKFNIGAACDDFSSMISNEAILSIAGLGFAASDSCFDPTVQLQSGFWWLLASIVARTAAWRFVPSL